MAGSERARTRMVDALCAAGRVRSPAIEAAFRAVPRHLFLPGQKVTAAYADEPVPVQVADGVVTSSASQPSMMAIMLEQLDLRPGQRVLEIGAGTGYNAALMASIVAPGGSVVSVDIDEDMIARAAGHLAGAGIVGVRLVAADGALGHAPGAPYDRIVLTVGSDDIRPEWIAQLVPGGRLLLPLAVRGTQLSVAFDLGADGLLRSRSVRSCAFIRLRGAAGSVDRVRRFETGIMIAPPGDAPDLDVDAFAAVLTDARELRGTDVPLGPMDVHDGFGLWLMLTEQGACRVLVDDQGNGQDDDPVMLGAGSGTIALTPGPGEQTGASMIVRPPGARSDRGVGPVVVRAFGPGGAVLAERLIAALDRWAAAGRPGAPDWRLTAVPGGGDPALVAGPNVIVKPHHTLLADLRPGPIR